MSGSPPAARNILLVDDEASIRSMLKAVLETENYAVETAINAADARGKLAAQDFHVVITDMRMETEVSGFEVVRVARRKSPHPGIIILTAFPLRESDWRAEGADAGFMKPVPIAEFLTAVEQLASSRAGAVR